MKKFMVLLLALVLILPMGVKAEEDEYSTKPVEQITETTPETKPESKPEVKPSDPSLDYADEDVIDPDFSVIDAENHLMKKLNEVVDLLKKIAQPISYIMFIVGAILMVFGAVGKRDGVKQGLIVCIVSIIMYAICQYSQPIVQAVANWLAS